MRMHYLHADGRWSNAADYGAHPEWTPEDGGTWVAGEPKGDAWVAPSLIDAFNQAIDALPEAVQIAILPILADGQLYIETGRFDRLRALINSVPLPEELAPLREQLLALLEKG